MSILTSDGQVKRGLAKHGVLRHGTARRGSASAGVPDGVAAAPADGGAPGRVVVRLRRAAGEIRRPPTRARVVASRRPARAVQCAPNTVPVRWPWLVGLAVASCLAITGLGLIANGMAASDVPAQMATVSLAPGETLADLATRFAPASDIDAVVARIKQVNGLGDGAIAPGVPLTVPVQPGLTAGGR
jgi:hypothetical protein